MNAHKTVASLLVAGLLLVGGCATRPINPPLTSVDMSKRYFIERKGQTESQKQNLVVLAFSGGGTRAAAFSYGVLETLRRTEITTRTGQRDQIDAMTGVSGARPQD